jgi:hypothetical protein
VICMAVEIGMLVMLVCKVWRAEAPQWACA